MDQSERYMNVNLGKKDSRSPTRAEPDVPYAEVKFKTLSAPHEIPMNVNLGSTDSLYRSRAEPDVSYADVNFKTLSAPRARTNRAEKELKSKVKFGNRRYRLICLLCLVTSALILIVVGLSINVSQIRHQFTEMETKYRSVTETKAQICELLTSRREQNCSENWITNKGRCYYVSTVETSFRRTIQECSKHDSRLLEINSSDEASFVSHKLLYQTRAYWIGKCEDGTVGLALLYNQSPGQSVCRDCESCVRGSPCDRDQRFICEKSAPLFADIPEEIHGLCQQPVKAT